MCSESATVIKIKNKKLKLNKMLNLHLVYITFNNDMVSIGIWVTEILLVYVFGQIMYCIEGSDT